LEEITEKFMAKILDMVNQTVQDALKKFKTPKIKNMRRHKEIKEHREDFNKHQSETKDIIKREIYELKIITQNIRRVEQAYGKISEKRIQQKSWK
jgi:hypothetical protein